MFFNMCGRKSAYPVEAVEGEDLGEGAHAPASGDVAPDVQVGEGHTGTAVSGKASVVRNLI